MKIIIKSLTIFSMLLLAATTSYSQTGSDLEKIREDYQNKKYKNIIEKYGEKAQNLGGKETYYLGMSYFLLEDDKNALKYLSNAIEKGPADWDMYYYKGQTLYYMKKYDEALPNINKAIQMLPSEPDFYIGKANVFIAMELNDSVINTLNCALKYDSVNLNALDLLGATYTETKNFKKAADVYKRILHLTKESSIEYQRTLYNIGLSELQAGLAKDAEQTFVLHLKKYPDDYPAIGKLIQALYFQGRFSETVDLKKQLYALHKKDKLPENMKKMFCFDQFLWKDKLVMSFELFDETDNGFKTVKYKFFVTDNNGNIESVIQSESSPAVRMSDGKYILAMEKDNNHYSYWFYKFNDDFNYTELKSSLIKILNGEAKPDASTIRGKD